MSRRTGIKKMYALCEAFRHQGIGGKPVSECEQWAGEKGCVEFAGGCELMNTTSLNFHLRPGFQEENRIICFTKLL